MDNINKECSICYEIMKKEQTIKLKCKHEFHINCVQKWIDTDHVDNTLCPYCKQDMYEKEGTDIVYLTKPLEEIKDGLKKDPLNLIRYTDIRMGTTKINKHYDQWMEIYNKLISKDYPTKQHQSKKIVCNQNKYVKAKKTNG